MKLAFYLILFLLEFGASNSLSAQQYLPEFSVIHISKGNNKISWINPYKNCIQLAVQRSTDSLKNFRTILSAQSPQLQENGFIDKKAPEESQLYYRIFYTLKGGDFYFSKTVAPIEEHYKTGIKQPKQEKTSSPKKKKKHTKIAESNKNLNSSYLKYDNKGNLLLTIPEPTTRNCSIVFYGSEKDKLFAIDPITETSLLIEKGNFLKGGWFEYELKESGKILERKKIYIQQLN